MEKEGKVSERKASPKKLYLADPGLFTILTERINLGAIVENLIYLTLAKMGNVRYHRSNGQEIDFVLNKQAFESKYKKEIVVEDLSALKFIRGYKGKTVVSENVEKKIERINVVPLWKFLLDNC